MAIQEVKTGSLAKGRTTTGRDLVKLPKVPSVTVLFVNITGGGTATVDIEVSDEPFPDPSNDNQFFLLKTITAKQVERVSLPASVIACNVTAISGATVNVTYRTIVYDGVPDTAIETFEEGDIRARRIVVDGTVTTALEGDRTRKKLAQAQASDSAGAIYTVPADTQAVIQHIIIANPTGSDRTITLWHGGSADGNVILPETTILAGGHGVFSGELSFEAGDTLQAVSDAGSALTITVSGYEQAVP